MRKFKEINFQFGKCILSAKNILSKLNFLMGEFLKNILSSLHRNTSENSYCHFYYLCHKIFNTLFLNILIQN